MKKVFYMLGLGALLANFALADEPQVEKRAATGENCAMKPTAEEQQACMKAQEDAKKAGGGEQGEGIVPSTGGEQGEGTAVPQ